MTVKEKRFTYRDYLKLEDDKRYEIIEGELLMAPAPRPYHQDVCRELFLKLHSYVKNKNLGKIYFAPVDVILDEENVVQPDILFISKERLGIIKERGIFGTPDLVVEVVSPSTFVRDTERKRKLYERFGVKEFWLLFPNDRVFQVWSLEEKGYELFSYAEEEGKIRSKIFRDFELDIGEVFII